METTRLIRKNRKSGLVPQLLQVASKNALRIALSLILPVVCASAALAAPPPAESALTITAADVRIEARAGGGYDLFIRAKPGLASVLLTESTKDPAMKADNFAYRAEEHNPVNGDEKRMLNGKLLAPESKLYSLISSTPVPDAAFGSAFHILIPSVLVYGYPWSRSGSVAVGKGTFVNIRAFAKPYADYSDAFVDNPYEINISYAPVAEPEQQAPAKAAPPDGSTSAKFGAILGGAKGGSLDLVICLDTTDSMVPYFEDIKKGLGPILRERVAGYAKYRIGVVLYKDYWPDEYITRKYPFTSDISKVEDIVRSAVVYGGGDIPEALYEALFVAATDFEWTADRRQVIFLTDAAPHPVARGKIEFSDVLREARARRIEIASIIVPPTISPPKPPHEEFENIAKRLASVGKAGASTMPKLLVLVAGPKGPDRLADVKEKLLWPLSSSPKPALLDASDLGPSTAGSNVEGPWFAARDAEALAAAAKAGAALLVLVVSLEVPAPADTGPAMASTASPMSQSVSRLIEVATGKELARDVVWRVGMPSGSDAEFINGLREK